MIVEYHLSLKPLIIQLCFSCIYSAILPFRQLPFEFVDDMLFVIWPYMMPTKGLSGLSRSFEVRACECILSFQPCSLLIPNPLWYTFTLSSQKLAKCGKTDICSVWMVVCGLNQHYLRFWVWLYFSGKPLVDFIDFLSIMGVTIQRSLCQVPFSPYRNSELVIIHQLHFSKSLLLSWETYHSDSLKIKNYFCGMREQVFFTLNIFWVMT